MRRERRAKALVPILIGFIAVLAAGCSTSTTTSGLNFVDEQGNHPAGWLSSHKVFAGADGNACADCHGADLLGGISRVSCFSASFEGRSCHADGPAFHPAAWLDKGGEGTNDWHATAYQNNTPPCADCHDLDVKCVLCHFSVGGNRVPAGSQYQHGATQGHSVFTAPVSDVCVNCHEVNNRFGYEPVCHNCHAPFPLPAGTHETGWLNPDNTAGFHGSFVPQITCETAACHPIPGHPTCTTCHFDNEGSRVSGSFIHVDPQDNHGDAQKPVGTICENCHQTERTFRAGSPPSCAAGPGGAAHPGNEGCHYDASLLDPVLTNPRF